MAGELLLGASLASYAEALGAPYHEGPEHVVLDPAVPLLSAEFVAEVVAQARASGRPACGVRPVTDTLKRLDGGLVAGTVDRAQVVELVGPLVLLAAPDVAPLSLVALVDDLHAAGQAPHWMNAPPAARRVADSGELRVVESLALVVGQGPP